jgi:hypothetical protein
VLATTGAFRVVPMEELRRPDDRAHAHRKDVERLRSEGLVQTMPYVAGKERTTLVTLTERGRQVLELSRRDPVGRQQFYAGIAKPRELAHDVRLHRAYRDSARQLGERGVRVRRVVLEQELKREYQAFLQAPNRGRREGGGRPQRGREEVARWAREHQLPVNGTVPIISMRLESVNSKTADDVRKDTTLKMHLWIFNREYRVTYRDSSISSEKVVDGKIAEQVKDGAPIFISLEDRYARNNGIKIIVINLVSFTI